MAVPESNLPEMSALQMATFEELFNELKSRHDACLFCGIDKRDGQMMLAWGGFASHAIGLGNYAAARIMGLLASQNAPEHNG